MGGVFFYKILDVVTEDGGLVRVFWRRRYGYEFFLECRLGVNYSVMFFVRG